MLRIKTNFQKKMKKNDHVYTLDSTVDQSSITGDRAKPLVYDATVWPPFKNDIQCERTPGVFFIYVVVQNRSSTFTFLPWHQPANQLFFIT